MSDDNLTGNNQREMNTINELIFLDIEIFDDQFLISIHSIASKHIFLNGFGSRASNTIKRFLH